MRLYSTITANNNINKLKRFEDIPTLKQLPIIGHSYLFFPGAKYQLERLTEAVEDISAKLGPIFKLKLGGANIIITTDADYTEALVRHEGKYPIRPTFPALLHYRRLNYGSVGVVPGNGEEWYKYRQGVLPLLKTNLVRSYISKHEKIADNFVRYIDENRNECLILEDIFTHLLKYTIEAISVVSPGHHFQCLSSRNAQDVDDIIAASIDFMDGLYKTFTGLPIWKYYKNEGYRKLETSHQTIHKILENHLKNLSTQTLENLQNANPYMNSLLKNPTYNWNDKLMLTMEVFLGGIDATATTIAVTLHHLAHNKKVQNLARNECTQDDTRLPYLKACVKESLRICPTGGASSRVTITDTNIAGYLIPKHTLVAAFSSVTSNKPEYFDEPDVYRPERWLRDSNCNVHPFASVPFGFGPRMCPGRRIAEQEIVVLLKKILTSYELKPIDGDRQKLGMVYRMNRIPDRKINIKRIKTNRWRQTEIRNGIQDEPNTG
ncbi:Cytochrome P450 [Popillia japonica]|uniref:Cytochrome P450 n=1 Tax=Popillia japonica TaxID=7064 RepID=A0AAW1KI57_POPJA